MTNEDRNKAKEIADQLESDMQMIICERTSESTYNTICKLALVAAKQVRKEIPMYTGNLNPKWAIYNFVVELLEGRLNGNLLN